MLIVVKTRKKTSIDTQYEGKNREREKVRGVIKGFCEKKITNLASHIRGHINHYLVKRIYKEQSVLRQSQ